MKKTLPILLFLIFCLALYSQKHIRLNGLRDKVEIIVDHWGIPHIYANNEEDLFFAQGYYAARDRLFQFEIWRRQATGTVAEILGPRALKGDIGARLFKFRGDMDMELAHYHKNGKSIISSYVRGINAYIDEITEHPENLPLEFSLLGIIPAKWDEEVVVSRHQGLLGNVTNELNYARLVSIVGEEKMKEWLWFHPKDPNISIDPKIDDINWLQNILELYRAFRRQIVFRPEDIASSFRNPDMEKYRSLALVDMDNYEENKIEEIVNLGSNNWVVNGNHSQSGYPMMANDPHRSLSVPSLRYMAHLNAPGWNVIGGGEPVIPGISIGHNEYGAWGLTVFRTDAEDLYVYNLNPENFNQYRYKGSWENMKVIRDTIYIKDHEPEIIDLKYTRHGPVCYVDSSNYNAFAVRCGWLDIGGSPYLASLRINQSKNFEEFREACSYSHIPGENMIWADKEGNIGWQAVGIAPIRKNWSGLIPVPGDGSHEWEGYLPIKAKPHIFNPPGGMIYTANANVTEPDYTFWDAIGFNWSDPYREDRVAELLGSGRKHSLMDMALYQTDYLSIPARQILPLYANLELTDEKTEKCRKILMNWDYKMIKDSKAAAIYNQLERKIRSSMEELVVPEKAQPLVSIQMKRVVDWLLLPDGKFGEDPAQGRDSFLISALENSIQSLEQKLGDNIDNWHYGQTNYKHVEIKHPLSNAVVPELRNKLNAGPAPRGGNSYTVNSTGGNENQSSGASFRMIVDTENWDNCIGTNSPGQSGNPDHPHYKNLFDLWSRDQYIPVFFSRNKIESVKYEVFELIPGR